MGPNGRPMSPGGGRMSPGPNRGPPRFVPPGGGRPMSPGGNGPMAGPPRPGPGYPTTPQFPPVPRSLSPGPGGRPPPRSMSPGPYGPGGMQKPPTPASQRRRSNSTSAAIRPESDTVSPLESMPAVPTPEAEQPKAEPEQPKSEPSAEQEQPAPAPAPVRSPPPSLGPVERKPVPGQAK